MDVDFSWFIFGLFMILPAVVVLLIFMVIRTRRGRFRRQRITSRSGRHHHEADKKA